MDDITALQRKLTTHKRLFVQATVRAKEYSSLIDQITELCFGKRHKFTNDRHKVDMIREILVYGEVKERRYKGRSHGLRDNRKVKDECE